MKKRKICVIIVLVIILLGIISVKMYHEVQSEKEKEKLTAYGVGNLIEVDDKAVNVLIRGQEDVTDTIVFMHGLGMGDTVISTEPMRSRLEKKYRTCTIDRYGNGMSDDTNQAQTVDVILQEYRNVLKNSGLKGPYILVAHSIAGMYATYWAEEYPEEVKAIIYLDADPAEWYVNAGEPEGMQLFLGKLQQMAASIGVQRFLVSDEMLIGQDEKNVFTQQQNEMRRYLMLQNTYSKATQSEFENYYKNASRVVENGISLAIPQLYIQAVSDGANLDYLEEKKKIMEERGNVSVVRIEGTHCLYEVEPVKTADLILNFLGEMDE